MFKKLMTLVVTLSVGVLLVACGSKLSQEKAEGMIKDFDGSLTTVKATFTQDYELHIDDERTEVKSFETKINETTVVEIDFTAGNLYYHAKKTSGTKVLEQIIVKGEEGYVFYTTHTLPKSLKDDAEVLAKIDELLKTITIQTSGYIDSNAFTYDNEWIQTFVLLGSENLEYNDEKYFKYTFNKTKNGGLAISGELDMVGYFGDLGTFEFGKNENQKGSTIKVETTKDGLLLSFEQTLSNHLDMRIMEPAVPLDLTGTRKLTVEHGVELTKLTEIEQILTPGTIVFNEVAGATITTYDFENGNFATLAVPSSTVSVGNFVVVKVVVTDETKEVASVKVNNKDTILMNGFYSFMEEAEAGKEYKVTVTLKDLDAEEPEESVIVLPEVEGLVITSYDFENNNFATLEVPSSTVTPGNFVTVKVEGKTPDDVVVKVNGQDTVFMNGYFVLMQAATAGTTYTVTVELVD